VAAEAAIARHPKRRALCEKSVALAPRPSGAGDPGHLLAHPGDERYEVLNGYDPSIQIFDLDPPEGFP
jgi:hypothetical protein